MCISEQNQNDGLDDLCDRKIAFQFFSKNTFPNTLASTAFVKRRCDLLLRFSMLFCLLCMRGHAMEGELLCLYGCYGLSLYTQRKGKH